MNDADRLIDWAKANGMGVDLNFRTGLVKLVGATTRKFKSVAEALAWATSFARNWGLPTP